jgi:hypothetical protein
VYLSINFSEFFFFFSSEIIIFFLQVKFGKNKNETQILSCNWRGSSIKVSKVNMNREIANINEGLKRGIVYTEQIEILPDQMNEESDQNSFRV